MQQVTVGFFNHSFVFDADGAAVDFRGVQIPVRLLVVIGQTFGQLHRGTYGTKKDAVIQWIPRLIKHIARMACEHMHRAHGIHNLGIHLVEHDSFLRDCHRPATVRTFWLL